MCFASNFFLLGIFTEDDRQGLFEFFFSNFFLHTLEPNILGEKKKTKQKKQQFPQKMVCRKDIYSLDFAIAVYASAIFIYKIKKVCEPSTM